ncbi:hypothetical protein TNCV_4797961 [Trichonephila clavipes]|nr:hypothetical protein TNCV_4797961 [Trichonephila clavipes]
MVVMAKEWCEYFNKAHYIEPIIPTEHTIPDFCTQCEFYCSPGRIIRFEEPSGELQVVSWPPNSLNMNPMKCLWFHLKTRIWDVMLPSHYFAALTSECLILDTSDYVSAPCRVNDTPGVLVLRAKRSLASY